MILGKIIVQVLYELLSLIETHEHMIPLSVCVGARLAPNTPPKATDPALKALLKVSCTK